MIKSIDLQNQISDKLKITIFHLEKASKLTQQKEYSLAKNLLHKSLTHSAKKGEELKAIKEMIKILHYKK